MTKTKTSASGNTAITRRQLIAGATAAVAFPTIVPASALGRQQGTPPPSERLTIGVIGIGIPGARPPERICTHAHL